MFQSIKADVKFNMMYTCRKCGKSRVGSTMRMEIKATSAIQVKERLDRAHAHANHMPDYWCAYGTDGFECDTCKPKK